MIAGYQIAVVGREAQRVDSYLREADGGIHGIGISEGSRSRSADLAPRDVHRAWRVRQTVVRHRPVQRGPGQKRDRLIGPRIHIRWLIDGGFQWREGNLV